MSVFANYYYLYHNATFFEDWQFDGQKKKLGRTFSAQLQSLFLKKCCVALCNNLSFFFIYDSSIGKGGDRHKWSDYCFVFSANFLTFIFFLFEKNIFFNNF